jgi:uncharacterized membrane protein YuzA (DUF378 family)
MHKVAFVLLIIGGLNWLLEAFSYGLGSWGIPAMIVKIIYVLVGLAAIYEIFTHKKNCRDCDSRPSM